MDETGIAECWVCGGFLYISLRFCAYLNISLARERTTPWFLDDLLPSLSFVLYRGAPGSSSVSWNTTYRKCVCISVEYFFFFLGNSCDFCWILTGVWCRRLRGPLLLERLYMLQQAAAEGPAWTGKELAFLSSLVWDSEPPAGNTCGLVLETAEKPTCRQTWWVCSFAPFILAKLSLWRGS